MVVLFLGEKKGNTRRETVWVGGAALEIKNSALTILKLVCALVIWVATGYRHLEFRRSELEVRFMNYHYEDVH